MRNPGLGAGLGEFGGNVEVGENALDVVVVVEFFKEGEGFSCGVGFELDEVLGEAGQLGHLGGKALVGDGLLDGVEVVGRGGDLVDAVLAGHVVGAGVDDQLHEFIFADGIERDGDEALGLEHPGDGAFELAAAQGENLAEFGGGAVAAVGDDVDEDGDAVGAVALVGEGLVGDAGEFAGAALDGALDVLPRAC